MQDKYSGAVTVGYAALFMTSWLSFMHFAGWTSFDSGGAALPFVMFFSIIMVVAGVFCFFNDAKVDSVLFIVIGTQGFSFSMRFLMMPNLEANTAYSAMDGWMLILIAIIVFYLWAASMKSNMIKRIFLLLFWLTFLAAALANWLALDIFAYIGGYLGLISAILSGWYSATTVLPGKSEATE